MARVEIRRASVRTALENAKHAYDAALSFMRELEAELNDINEEHLSTTRRFQAVRDAYRRELVARLPDDIVRCIFEQALPARTSADFMDMQLASFGGCYQTLEEARLPFALASVCRQWRTVALGISALWSFIYISKTTRTHFERVLRLLERSKAAPLDISFDPDQEDPEVLRGAMMDALQEHTRRWKRVQMTHLVRPDDFALVRRQAPHLRGLMINVQRATADGAPPDSTQHYLWLGPHIEELALISPWQLIPRAPYPVTR
ncbi:hypothetical protein AURDEDRAFT_159164 [Auricularia subglabra TFB-10046 SS5]|nr:hypothetical protein AURDEDRAFT_159164 [Auricularia subglabra TFB-10046 SS5]